MCTGAHTAMVCFDLQNLITCPKVDLDISSFFYRRKMNVYNLTARVSINGKKQAYCAIWSECHTGRGVNEIASTHYRFLCDVCQKPP